jgi:hypothetical protein
MSELIQMIEDVCAEREWFRERFRQTGNHGFSIEAWACSIREKALLDAKRVIEGGIGMSGTQTGLSPS